MNTQTRLFTLLTVLINIMGDTVMYNNTPMLLRESHAYSHMVFMKMYVINTVSILKYILLCYTEALKGSKSALVLDLILIAITEHFINTDIVMKPSDVFLYIYSIYYAISLILSVVELVFIFEIGIVIFNSVNDAKEE